MHKSLPTFNLDPEFQPESQGGNIRSIFTLFGILLVLAVCSQNQNPRFISGTILDGNENPAVLAHAHVFEFGDNPFSDQPMVAIEADGNFKLQIPNQEYLELMVTAANHPRLIIPLISQDINTDIRLDIRCDHL